MEDGEGPSWSVLSMVRWWDSLGLTRRGQRRCLERAFPPPHLVKACKLLLGLRAEADRDGEEDPEGDPGADGRERAAALDARVALVGGEEAAVECHIVTNQLLEQFHWLWRHGTAAAGSGGGAAGERLRRNLKVDAETLVRVSGDVMNLRELLRGGGGGPDPFRRRRRRVAEDDPIDLECPHCKKSFLHRSDLSSHIRKYHETGAGFMCSFCGEVFGSRGGLREHERSSHGEEAEEAQGELNSKIPQVLMHMEEEQEAKGAYKDNKALAQHVCMECGRSFTRRCRLREHIDCVHELLRRRFPCGRPLEGGDGDERCEAAFNSRWLLRQHVAVVHLGQRRHRCPECGKRFGYVHHVRSHMKHRHREAHARMLAEERRTGRRTEIRRVAEEEDEEDQEVGGERGRLGRGGIKMEEFEGPK